MMAHLWGKVCAISAITAVVVVGSHVGCLMLERSRRWELSAASTRRRFSSRREVPTPTTVWLKRALLLFERSGVRLIDYIVVGIVVFVLFVG
jgi:hypothetical protein